MTNIQQMQSRAGRIPRPWGHASPVPLIGYTLEPCADEEIREKGKVQQTNPQQFGIGFGGCEELTGGMK